MKSVHYSAKSLLPGLTAAIVAAQSLSTTCRADDLYVAEFLAGRVSKVSTTGSVSTYFPANGDASWGVAFDSAGNLFIGTQSGGHGAVLKYTTDGVTSTFYNMPSSWAHDLTFDSAGNLYVAEASFNTHGDILKITSDGVSAAFCTTANNSPLGLTFDQTGNLYFGDNYQIKKVTPDGSVSVFATTPSSYMAYGLAFDSAGTLYASLLYDNAIEKFTPAGVGSIFANTNLNGPLGLAFDSAGNLFATNINNHSITEITPDGVTSIFKNLGSGQPTYITAQPGLPIPEPTSLSILALTALPLLARRSRQHRGGHKANRVKSVNFGDLTIASDRKKPPSPQCRGFRFQHEMEEQAVISPCP